MQSKDNAGCSHAQSAKKKTREKRRVKQTQGHRNRECGNSVAGGKRETVRRQQTRPAMRLHGAGPLAVRNAFQNKEYCWSGAHREESGFERIETAFSAELQKDQTERSPKPAV